MTSIQSKAIQHPVKRPGLFGRVFKLFSALVTLLVVSIVFSILFEWIGMTFFYPESGYHHAQEMAQAELYYLRSITDGDGLNTPLVDTASQWIQDIVNAIFIDSDVVTSLHNRAHEQHSSGVVANLLKDVLAQFYIYIIASMYIFIMFLMRLTILLLSAPVFMTFGAVGLCDGLMQRDLRRWCGGHESGFIYHWSKQCAMPTLVVCCIVYLSIPWSLHPNIIITPFAMVFGLVLMVMASKFKKYL